MKPSQSNKSSRKTDTRRIGVVAFPGSQILDIAGPLAVFAEANQFCQNNFNVKQAAYQIELMMSPRNFARVFAEQIGVTPARFVSQVRVEAARRRLEESSQPVELIAEECGFGSAESMRSAFQRLMHVSPQEYRKRFHLADQGEQIDEPPPQSPRLLQRGDGRDHHRRLRRPAGKSGKGKNRREQTAS